MSNPKVSVIMSVYNAEKFICKTLDSILNQKFIDFEFLIIDDCSNDKSHKIISSYKDGRIKVFKNKINQGYVHSLNQLITHSKGEYIARQDHDDISLPDRLMLQVRYMENNLDVGICGTNAIFFGKKHWHTSMPLNDQDIRANMIIRNPFIHSSVMIRRSLLLEDNSMKYDLSYYPAEDYYLWFKISTKAKLANLPNALLLIRWHNSNVSHLNENIQNEIFKKIRHKIVEQAFSIELSEEEKSIHNLLPITKNISLFDIHAIEKWYLKLLMINRREKSLSENSLRKVILIYWIIVCFHKNNIPLKKRILIFFNSKIFNIQLLMNLFSFQNFKNLIYKY
ncbi:MAG: glycosyltransferase [Bacteroidetes bacterium]|nr:glycosyltransferase [Bacteroidota bacterium]